MSVLNKMKEILLGQGANETKKNLSASESSVSEENMIAKRKSRTPEENELSFEFSMNQGKILEKLEDKIYRFNTERLKATNIDEEIELCKKTIRAYEDLEKFCHANGRGGVLYFDGMWEHCHNSQSSDFRFIDPVEKSLKYLTENYLEEREKREDQRIADQLAKIGQQQK